MTTPCLSPVIRVAKKNLFNSSEQSVRFNTIENISNTQEQDGIKAELKI